MRLAILTLSAALAAALATGCSDPVPQTADGAYDPTATEPNERFKDMIEEGHVFQRGYSVVFADLRGFGASSGCNDFGGVGEQADVKAAVEWAASQPWSSIIACAMLSKILDSTPCSRAVSSTIATGTPQRQNQMAMKIIF